MNKEYDKKALNEYKEYISQVRKMKEAEEKQKQQILKKQVKLIEESLKKHV